MDTTIRKSAEIIPKNYQDYAISTTITIATNPTLVRYIDRMYK